MHSRTVFWLIVFLGGVSCALGCGGTWNATVPVPEHLYGYSESSLLDPLRAKGFAYEVLDADVRRNGSGTKIFVREDEILVPQGEKLKRTFVFTKGEVDGPELILRPEGATEYWLGDDGRIFAWADGAGAISFASKATFALAAKGYATVGFDDSGAFMYAYSKAENRTDVYKVPALETPVLQFNSLAPPKRLYANDARIVVYGGIRSNPNRIASSIPEDATFELRRFQPSGAAFIEREPLTLPSRSALEDLDPFSSWVLVLQYNDLPLPQIYFLMDLNTGKATRIGAVNFGIPFFLESDILGSDLLKKYKQ